MVRETLRDQSLFEKFILHVAQGTANVKKLHAMSVRISDQGLLDLAHLELHELVALGQNRHHIGQLLELEARLKVLLLAVVAVEEVQDYVHALVPDLLELSLQPLVFTE